jgi:hypothetical protein
MTPLAPGEPDIWPEDPLFCLASVAMVRLIRNFIMLTKDPTGFEELVKNAPADWSFCSLEGQEEDEPGRLVERPRRYPVNHSWLTRLSLTTCQRL